MGLRQGGFEPSGFDPESVCSLSSLLLSASWRLSSSSSLCRWENHHSRCL